MKLLWIAIIFLIIGGYMIKTAYDFDFEDKTDQKNFIIKFLGWIKGLAKNTKEITGLVIKQDWLPKNLTNSTE